MEVFNYYADDSFGFDANLQMAQASWWAQYQSTLRLIADHIYFFGHVPAELAPGHCGLDPFRHHQLLANPDDRVLGATLWDRGGPSGPRALGGLCHDG